MQSGDKRLKGKEMSVPDSNNMEQIQCAEGDSGGEEREKEGEVGLRVGGRGIGNAVELAAAEIKGVGLSAVERAGTSAAEDGELVAGLVDGTVTIDALRNGESGTAGMRGGDKFGSGARAKAGEMGRVVPRGEALENAEAVLAVGDEGECAGGDHADFYIVDVIELAFSGENLIEVGRDEGFVREDISEGAGDGDAARGREYAVRVERESALQEIVGGVAVEERADTWIF